MGRIRHYLPVLLAAALATAVGLGCSDRTPLPSSRPGARIDAALDLGPIDPAAEVDLMLALELRQPLRLGKFLSEQPRSGDTMTPIDFATEFGPSVREYTRITAWLTAHGFAITRTTPSRTTISVRATAAVVERALGTQLHDFRDADGRFVAAVAGMSLVPELSGSIGGIVGVEGGLPWVSHAIKPRPQAGTMLDPYGAAQLETLYNASGLAGTSPGAGQTVVILGAGNAPVVSDLTGYYSTFKPYGFATQQGAYDIELIGGATRDEESQAESFRGENTLDVEMVTAFAPFAHIVHVVTATTTPGLFADGVTAIVNGHADAHAVSVSYGTCERGAAGAMPVLHALFAQAKAQGQTWFIAAGDTGTDACRSGTSNKTVSAGWPASAPWVMGVGGTQLDDNNVEVVWNSYGTNFPAGTGGGVSESLDKPAYQVGVTPNDGARDEPDVAALAGYPYVSVYMVEAGSTDPILAIGGTSASAPMWAGIWALLEQSTGGAPITNSHERLYELGKLGKGFHDVVSGNNGGPSDTPTGGYPAVAGYDLSTGWGTPNTADLLASWK
jgi:subtilase family serine protease